MEPISENFARCLAKILGDGNLYYRYIRYNNTSDILRKEFVTDIKKEFGNINFTYGIGNSGTKFVQIHGNKIIKKFLEHHKNFKSKEINIPNSIKNGGIIIKKHFLRAFFDDEGSPSLRLYQNKEWKRSISLTSSSLKILEEIKSMLKEDFKINTNKIIKDKKSDKFWYVLFITGKSNYIRYRQTIGFKHPLKVKRLDLIINSYENTYYRNKNGFNKILNNLKNLKVALNHISAKDGIA